ncbi:hypothetical protein C7M52_01085 [Mixta theicola]|mgnify:CR=1 FL=1|nr:MaoC/PaaZ C-terminal domain-containing protein [Mixta theicola]QHM75136.1 hypothetical protein C7M52_01085 [Mixta theicola]
MTTSFSQDQISEWAYFSGDHNKVHFDEEIAKKNGLNGVIVQGMLVLQDAKKALTQYIGGPSRIKFYLKEPVYRDKEIIYLISRKNDEYHLKVHDINGCCCITGRASPEKGETDIVQAKHNIAIDRPFLEKQIQLYQALYPEAGYSWMIMDALLFSVCFKYQNGDPFYAKAQKITLEPDKSKVVTFQVDQDIFITEDILTYDCADLNDLTFYYEDQDVVKEDYSVYSLLNYQIYRRDKLLYQASMGSITRAFEAQNRAINKR